MPVGKKLVVAVSVMATGAGAALFFRKDASQVTAWHEAHTESPFRERVERRVASDAALAKTAVGVRHESASSTGAFRVPTAETAAISRQPLADSQPTLQKSFNPVGALLEPIQDLPDESSPGESAGDGAESRPLAHTIADGDTLSQLAERYLGRGEKYLEIFELNRDVLASPDLLPIGAVLKIPPRDGAKPPSALPAAPAAESALAPPQELVPVERDRPAKAG